ncbi:YkoP family protein [Bacillaceae bacterium W0354]
MLVKIWTALDPIYYKLTRLTYIKEKEDFENIFRVRLLVYKGPEVTLKNGVHIKKNDLLVKIHLHNIRLLNEIKHINGEIRKVRYIQRIVEQSLPGLAHYIEHHPRKDEIKAVVGITTIRKCIRSLGFETFELNNRMFRILKFLTCAFIYFSFNPGTSIQSLKNQVPVYLFMSKENLLNFYER